MASRLQIFAFFVHMTFCVLYYLTLYYDLQIAFPSNKLYAGRWKYLTFLNLVSHVIYFTLAVLVDVWVMFSSGKMNNTLIKIRDQFFAVLAFPVGVFVCISFWGIYIKNRELIFPKWMDTLLSPMLNHALHTMCAVSMLIEAVIVKHKYPSRKHGLMAVWTITLLYIMWVHWVAYYAGFWVYPILKSLGTYARSIFLGLSAIVSGIVYLYGYWLTKLVWSPDVIPSEAEKPEPVVSKSKPAVKKSTNDKPSKRASQHRSKENSETLLSVKEPVTSRSNGRRGSKKKN